MVQIVPTFIFLLLLAPPPEFFNQLGTLKGGYWFTFVLFEYFILYMLIVRISIRWSVLMALAIAIGSFIYARYFDSIRASSEGWQLMIINALGFASVTLWRLFLFFYLGAWVRRHFDAFIRWTNKPVVIAMITIMFFIIASTPHLDNLWYEILRFYLGGITGMWMVFTFFRLSVSWLQKIHLSQPLQYVGTRTLDVYLIHYFFLPRFLMAYSPQLHAYHNGLFEFVVIMAISLVVLLASLIVSYIFCLSPFFARYLFGKSNKQIQESGAS
jgi:hypothetical protein